jgi:hypothetical protein
MADVASKIAGHGAGNPASTSEPIEADKNVCAV